MIKRDIGVDGDDVVTIVVVGIVVDDTVVYVGDLIGVLFVFLLMLCCYCSYR